MNHVPLPIIEGQAFLYQNTRYVFHGRVGGRLHIIDDAGNVLLIEDEALDGEIMPSAHWFLQEYIRSNITIVSASQVERDKRNRLDLAAAVVRDPVSLKRFTWGQTAVAARLPRNPHTIEAWIKKTPYPEVPDVPFCASSIDAKNAINAKLRAAFATKPSARSVIAWMNKVKKGEGIGAFVNKAGRPEGHSQLSPKVDQLVARAAELFYDRPHNLPTMEDAAGLAEHWWRLLHEAGEADIGREPPTYETVRRRIRKNENFDNYRKRYGLFEARAKFAPKGEPIEVTRPFELIYMDGVEFQHYTRYSDEWKELADKMKAVVAMDVFSQFRWPFAVAYGPFRPSMSIEALMNVLTPKDASAEDIEADPTSLIFGVPSAIAWDNDRALLPPSIVPSLMQLGQIDLNGAYHPDAKSLLERSFRFDKERLSGFKGRVLPPRRKRDPRYDPAKDADLTKAQYVIEIERSRRLWNSTPKASLGDRSPNEVMLEYITQVGVARYHATR